MSSQAHIVLSRFIASAVQRLDALRQVHAEMLDGQRYQEADALQFAIAALEGEIKADASYVLAQEGRL